MSIQKDRYYHPKVHFANCCSYALPLAALRIGLSVHLLGQKALTQHGIKLNRGTRLGNVFQISDGNRSIVFNKTRLQPISDATKLLSINKLAFKQRLEALGINESSSVSVHSSQIEQAINFANTIGFPVVVKPVSGSMGNGVFVNLSNADELTSALRSSAGTVLLEKHVNGREVRVYVLAGKIIAEIERLAPIIQGDGHATIKELIQRYRIKRKRLKLPYVKDFHDFDKILHVNKLNYDFILPAGEALPLTEKVGRSSGGIVHCKHEQFNPKLNRFAEKVAAEVKDLPFFALDLIINEDEVCILEMNARPQISSLLFPDSGVAVDFPRLYLEHFFGPRPESDPDAIYDLFAYRRQLRQNPNRETIEVCAKREMTMTTSEETFMSQPELTFTLGNIHQVLLKREAWRHGLRVNAFKDHNERKKWSVQSPSKAILFRSHMPASTPHKVRLLTNDKYATKEVLIAANIRTPIGRLFAKTRQQEAFAYIAEYPNQTFVVKPLEGSGGTGVSTGIIDAQSLDRALRQINHQSFIVEEHITGEDYRLMIVNGKFVAAIHRVPAHVVGNGKLTIQALIDEKNLVRERNPYLRKSPIRTNENALERIAKAGYQLDSVLPAGQRLTLSGVANLSAGGDSIDVTEQVHPSFIALAEKVDAAFGQLAFCGVDLLTPDIRAEAQPHNHAFIEVNANCDIAMHHFPIHGAPRNIAKLIIRSLFPESANEMQTCKTFLIRGKVQKVGYRKWLQRVAFSLGLVGTVENLANGRVKAVLQGSKSALEEIMERMMRGPEKAAVKSITCEVSPSLDTQMIVIKSSRS